MPGFNSLEALQLVRDKGLDLPFIIVSGQIGEDVAVKAMKAGAHDYIMKGNLKRLGPAIERELEESASRSKRRKVEEELREKEEELRLSRKMETMKDEFIGMVSHELKTPITVLMGSIYTALSEGISKEEARQLLKDAASSTESLAGIIDNLLDLSRAQANRLVIKKEPVDIAQIVHNVTDKLKGRSAIHRLVVDVPKGLAAVAADHLRVERVLYNLMENAIKYSPRGGDVVVFAQQKDDYLTIGVKDSGMGISAEDQARLFAPFERLETADGIGGIGLGLNVCRRLIEAHGGRIWVESQPGEGSTFFFTLPLD
jgi:signal transduction histidine kinase